MAIDKRINYRGGGRYRGGTSRSSRSYGPPGSKSRQSAPTHQPSRGPSGPPSVLNPPTKKKTTVTTGGPPSVLNPPPKKKTTTWTPGAGKPTHIPTKKTTITTGGPPSVLNPPLKKKTVTPPRFKDPQFLHNLKLKSIAARNRGVNRGINSINVGAGWNALKNYASIPATYFGAMLPGRMGEWATGAFRTDEMDENLANLINQKMTTGPTFDDKSGNISYADYGLKQGYDARPTYDTEGRIEKWTMEPNTAFVAPSLKEMAGMDSAALANALTVGNVGYSKDADTGKMSYTGTEYDDLGSKLFDTKPTKIPLNLNLSNGGIVNLFKYGGYLG